MGPGADRRAGPAHAGPQPDRAAGARPPARAAAPPLNVRESPVADPAVPRFELTAWMERYGVLAGVTGRPLNLGLSTGERVDLVMARWRAVVAAFAPPFPSVVLSHQVHGQSVRWHHARHDGWLLLDGLDGHATDQPGLLLAVTVADCVPVYLTAPGSGSVALLHAGWRGTAGGVLGQGARMVAEHASVTAGDLVMHCGVGICGDCYEVGPEVVAALAASVPQAAAATGLRAEGPGASHVDLRAVLALQARELGIGAVSVSAWCSAHDREQFFSHRASGGRDGRMMAYLGRPLTPA